MTAALRTSIILVLFAAGCATAPRVILQHDSGSMWRATYEFAQPVHELRFDRPTMFRPAVFEVATPGYAFAKDGEKDVLRASAAPSRTIEVRFPEHSVQLVKEYNFFQKFTDGSVAIYTGHLNAASGSEKVRDFRFVPRQGESIVVGGKRTSSTVDWRDADGEGTYVYFGSIVPIETADTISVIDPGLPNWLEQRTRDTLPRLFALYADRLGVKLPQRPTVLFNYEPTDASGFNSGGGTLANLIQLRVEGKAWERESGDGLLHLFHFLAHEAAHLWNGQIVNYPGSAHSWMHEGGADGLAERALLALGVIDEARYLEYQTAALNECRRGLGRWPLHEASKRGEFGLYYACGNALALFADAAVDADLFAFWKSLVARTLARSDHHFDVPDYIAVWRVLGASEADAAQLRALVDETADPEALAAALRKHGVKVVETTEVPQQYGQSLSRAGLLQLLAENCKGSYGYRATPRGFVLNDSMTCNGIPAGGTVRTIGGENVVRAGERAWDAMHATCGPGASITVRIDSNDVSVACSKPVAKRPAYVRIER